MTISLSKASIKYVSFPWGAQQESGQAYEDSLWRVLSMRTAPLD